MSKRGIAVWGTDSGSNPNCAPEGKRKAGLKKGETRRAVLISILHVSEGCWPGRLGLVMPIMEMQDVLLTWIGYFEGELCLSCKCRMRSGHGLVPLKVKNAGGLAAITRGCKAYACPVALLVRDACCSVLSWGQQQVSNLTIVARAET